MATFYLIIEFKENVWKNIELLQCIRAVYAFHSDYFFNQNPLPMQVQPSCPATGITRSNQIKTVSTSAECICNTEVHTLLSDQLNSNKVCNSVLAGQAPQPSH